MLYQIVSEDEAQHHPPVGRVLDLLSRMDAQKHSLITLQPSEDPDSYLMIGGGAGQFIACATKDNQTFHNATHPGASGGDVTLLVGGQESVFPPWLIISLAQAQGICRKYWLDQSLDESIIWETQGPA